jgi:hypothetical protein
MKRLIVLIRFCVKLQRKMMAMNQKVKVLTGLNILPGLL